MKTHKNLWQNLCSYENLFLAYRKARKHKSSKSYVIEFENNLVNNLLLLRSELLLHSYGPKPLVNFVIHEPKTRKISKSNFRDRIVHHALCNIIEPIFDKLFICDSYANRKSKGTLKAIQRFDFFKRKASKNNTINCYVLKADIKHYFEEVNHLILLNIIKRKIKDEKVVWLIKQILNNHKTKSQGKGMPLGNLTSQFFANIYLNELDQFVKYKLNIKYYLRYVDDFIILHSQKEFLEYCKQKIDNYLDDNLKLALHPNKSKIIPLENGAHLLGYRIFYYHKLLKRSNIKKFERKFNERLRQLEQKEINHEDLKSSMQGWFGYAIWADTYKLRTDFMKEIYEKFGNGIPDKDIDRWLKG